MAVGARQWGHDSGSVEHGSGVTTCPACLHRLTESRVQTCATKSVCSTQESLHITETVSTLIQIMNDLDRLRVRLAIDCDLTRIEIALLFLVKSSFRVL